jgi:thiamine pyrophosphate-dependent acetolactate synthase large subunit-like protein
MSNMNNSINYDNDEDRTWFRVKHLHLQQVDVCAEELHNSVPAKVAIHADIGVFTRQLIQQLASHAWSFPVIKPWWGQLNTKSDKNKAVITVSLFLGLSKAQTI